jgi:hypothetical protein
VAAISSRSNPMTGMRFVEACSSFILLLCRCAAAGARPVSRVRVRPTRAAAVARRASEGSPLLTPDAWLLRV